MGRVIQLFGPKIYSTISNEATAEFKMFSDISKGITAEGKISADISKYVELKDIKISSEIKSLYASQYFFGRCPIVGSITQLNYFNSMEGNDNNTVLEAPLLEEYNAKFYWRAWVVCPELGATYEIPAADIGEPFIEWELNAPLTFGFTLKNFDRKYTDPDNTTWGDIFTKDHWSALRQTRKFIKIGLLSICGEQQEYLYFPELVIKEVTGELVLSVSGIDKISDLLYRVKDWDSFCFEDICVKVDSADAPVWRANTSYNVGDLVSWNTFTGYTVQGDIDYIDTFAGNGHVYENYKFEFTSSEATLTIKKTKTSNGVPIAEKDQVSRVNVIKNGGVIFRCKTAGTTGATEPAVWPYGFLLPGASYRYFFNPLLGFVSAEQRAAISKIFPSGYGEVTDGSCVWEAVRSKAFNMYTPVNLTHTRYNPACGSEIRVNNIVKTEITDFTYSENARCISFVKTFEDENFTVLFRNPMTAKQIIAKVLDDAITEIYGNLGINEQIPAVYNFKDFKCFTEIQVQNIEAMDIVKQVLESFCGEFLIFPLNENSISIIFRDAVLVDEIPSRADFVRHENLIRNRSISDSSTNAINTINVIRPARVQTVKAKIDKTS